jgi:stage IV sporulation protein FB
MHYNLLIFNLLPIVPLDGSKLLNLFLNKIFSFRLSLILTNIFSFLMIILLLLLIMYKWNLLLFITLILLIFKTIKELKSINYIFNKFLLERYIKNLKIVKTKYIKGLNLKKMHRDYKHIFILDKKYYTEREIIRKKFDLQRKVW